MYHRWPRYQGLAEVLFLHRLHGVLKLIVNRVDKTIERIKSIFEGLKHDDRRERAV
jgi:hypothetical protein